MEISRSKNEKFKQIYFALLQIKNEMLETIIEYKWKKRVKYLAINIQFIAT